MELQGLDLRQHFWTRHTKYYYTIHYVIYFLIYARASLVFIRFRCAGLT